MSRSMLKQHPYEIRLLDALPSEALDQLQPRLQQVRLNHRQMIHIPSALTTTVYFPVNSAFALVNFLEDGSSVEVGTFGNGGMVGLPHT